MRTRNSIINSIVALISYIILSLGPFFLSPFIASLGTEVLGIQKTFVDTVSLLSIVELGISFGIIYKLYKPIADGDKKKIAILLNFYKNAFKVIALLVFLLGVILSFVIPKLCNSPKFSAKWIACMFFLYVFDTLSTYLFGHKRAMLIADQKNYIVNICRTSCQLIMYVFQIISICIFGSFEFYVISKLIFTLLEAILIHIIYNKNYSDIDLKTNERMSEKERIDLFKNLGALFYHKVGYKSLTSGSTLIITNKLGEAITGVYYPYTLITNGLSSITEQVFSSILSSFGNLLAKGTKEDVFNVYKKVYFLNHLIFSFFTVSLFCLVEPFIKFIWMGPNFLFPIDTVLLITVNFYMLGMRQSITMVKNSAGLYRPDRYFALLEAAINIFLSLSLVECIGINGVLISNIFSSLLIPFWTQPYIVYKNVFKRSVMSYYKKYFVYMLVTLFSGLLSFYLCSLCKEEGILKLFFNAVICLFVPNLINLVIFYRTTEQQYFLGIIRNLFTKFRMRDRN